MLVAIAIRAALAVHPRYLIANDETLDYLEQGFRLDFGYGLTSWIVSNGFRSYLLPGLIAGIIKVAVLLDPAPDFYLGAVGLTMSVLSLSVVVTAYLWGHRAGGIAGGLITGGLAAVWYELIYFAAPTLTEIAATDALILGAYLLEPARTPLPRLRLAAAGAFLALSFFLRLQVAPAMAVLAIIAWWRRGWRTVLWLMPGAIAVAAFCGVLDWLTLGYPFKSVVMNVWGNLFAGVADLYGHQPLLYYFNIELYHWNGAFPLIVLLCLIGAFAAPHLFAAAVAIVVAHSLIGHKEYRFIFPALPFVIVLVGLGTTRVVEFVGRSQSKVNKATLCAVAIAFWCATSAALATGGAFRREWTWRSGIIQAARYIVARHDVCGIASYGLYPSELPGYVRLHHNVPIYTVSRPERFPQDAVSFNVVIAAEDHLPPASDFVTQHCWDDGYVTELGDRHRPRICVMVRPGACQPGAISDRTLDQPPPGWESVPSRVP